MSFLGRKIETQVVYCQPQEDGSYSVGLRMAETDSALRAEPRIPVELSAQVHIAGNAGPLSGRVVDISGSGLGLRVAQQVSPGDMAFVELEVGAAFGEIRYCSRAAAEFRIGLKLDEFIPREDQILAAKARAAVNEEKPGGFGRFFRRK